ncbi:MAG TPA: helix-turn-helix domain-containing protein [Vicinamibacteria bacterium]|nr:helix-turn-helix domain-containing protein [Vicinamibacteria bacterium]
MISVPPFAPPTDTPPLAPLDLLPRTLGKKIQKDLKQIASEVQELAEDLRSGLRQNERELVVSPLAASRHNRTRRPKVALDTLPDRLNRRIKRLALAVEEVNTSVTDLAANLKRRLEASERQFVGPQNELLTRDLMTRVQDYERELIISALEACGMNQVLAAKALGVLPTTLSEKLKRLGLRRSVRKGPRALKYQDGETP